MTWKSGKYTSYPSDGSCFLERDIRGRWWIYKTDASGSLKKGLNGFARHTPQSFASLHEAQEWVEANLA